MKYLLNPVLSYPVLQRGVKEGREEEGMERNKKIVFYLLHKKGPEECLAYTALTLEMLLLRNGIIMFMPYGNKKGIKHEN
jgi:hypothetical protein